MIYYWPAVVTLALFCTIVDFYLYPTVSTALNFWSTWSNPNWWD